MGETSLLEAEGLGRGIAYYISRNGLRELVATNHGKGVLAQVNQEKRAVRPRQKYLTGSGLGDYSERSLSRSGLFPDLVLLGTDPEPLNLIDQGCTFHSAQAAGGLGLVASMRTQSENNLLALP